MPKKIKEKKDVSENQPLNEQSSMPEQPIVDNDDQQPSSPEQPSIKSDVQQPSSPQQTADNKDIQQPVTPERPIINLGPPNIKMQRREAIRKIRKEQQRELPVGRQLFPPDIAAKNPAILTYSKVKLEKLKEQVEMLLQEDEDKENTPKPSRS